MSREIKFRVWSVIRESWVHPVLDITNDFKLSDNENRVIEQFTGLKDKNGVDIYEGDVLSNGWIISFKDGMFGIFDEHHHMGINTYMSSFIKVIGNVHENKD